MTRTKLLLASLVGMLSIVSLFQLACNQRHDSHRQATASDASLDACHLVMNDVLQIPDVVEPVISHQRHRFRMVVDKPRSRDASARAARRNLARRSNRNVRRAIVPANSAEQPSVDIDKEMAAPSGVVETPATVEPPSKLIEQGETAAHTRREKLDQIIAAHVKNKQRETCKVYSGKFPFQRPKRGLTHGNGWHIPNQNMSQAQLHRKQRLQQTLDFYYGRLLNTRDDSPWSMMHHMIAWSVDSRILIGGPQGRNVSTIGWLCANGRCEGERMLFVKDDLLLARTGPGLQGHQGQFLAMLAQARVGPSQRIVVGDYDKTLVDLILQEQKTCRPRSELSFKLIGLGHYLHTTATWKNDRGQQWDFPKLIREELQQPINGTTCGGTHRLMGLTYAVRRREQDELPVTGDWARARDFAVEYQNRAFRMQNRDGSFSSDFWRSAGTWGDANRKLKTTGHILEWLVFSLPHDRLDDRQLTLATDYLINTLTRNRYFNWDKGPLGHGIRALALYNERVYGQRIGSRMIELAERKTKATARKTEKKSR